MTRHCLSSRLLLHVGYHKTGSTWFQSRVFAREDLGFCTWKAPRHVVHQLFCAASPFEPFPDGLLADLVAQATSATEAGKVFVVSHERLSGYPASGGYDAGVIAARLHRVFPNATVFGLFRRQPDMILSAWRQQIVDGGDLSLWQFLNPVEPQIVRVPRFAAATYRYSGLVGRYREIFGAERALFLPYEMFVERPLALLQSLAERLQLPVFASSAHALVAAMVRDNPSLSPTLLAAMRKVNLLFVRTQMSPHALVDLGAARIRGAFRVANRFLAPPLRPLDRWLASRAMGRIAKFCAQQYLADNETLQQLIGVSLAEYGYDLPTPTASDFPG